MTVVVGTAGHIDHGKTALLHALTGIDADRLPEERRRGMTIDVGYAHLALDDGTALDFVDVPGHDRLVGNMLVGAGEIDAAMLVVAADDGPRAQTLEHLALLDALAIADGLVVVTKTDAVEPSRVDEVVAAAEAMLAGTTLAGRPIVRASSVTRTGLDDVRAELVRLRDRVQGRAADPPRPPTLALDRVFAVKGRGVVVTGTLRGGLVDRRTQLRLLPGGAPVRVREIQVHGGSVDQAGPGRTALNLAGIDASELHRGQVLTADPEVVESSRVLVRLARPVADRARGRVHVGTAAVDAAISRSGRDAIDLPDGGAIAVLRLDEPVAVAPGDRFLVRRPAGRDPITGGVVLDVAPSRGVSRRRQTLERVAALAAAVVAGDPVVARIARLDLHGALVGSGRVALAPDVLAAAEAAALAAVAPEAALATVRAAVAAAIRRLASVRRDDATSAAAAVIDDLVEAGRLARDGGVVRRPGIAAPTFDPAVAAAMDRLEAALTRSMPPPLPQAARDAGCPPAGIRELERSGRIVVLDADLAYAMPTYRDLTARALAMAAREPLAPSAFRDATGTSRKYVMAILEDLDRRGILRRTPDGHVPGPRAPTPTATR